MQFTNPPHTAATPWNRRRFLRTTTLAAGAAFAPAIFTESKAAASDATGADVLIIGAGMAGVAAGQLLKQKGRRVTVLEARGWVGGRVHTQRTWRGPPVDMGAGWIHDYIDNPLYPLAQKYHLKTIFTPYSDFVYRRINGQKLDGLETAELLANYGELMGVAKYADARQKADLPDVALQDGINAALAAQTPPFTAPEVFDMGAPLNTLIKLGTGAELYQNSLYYYGVDGNVVGPADRLFPQGFDQLTGIFAAGLNIRRNTVVEEIFYDNKGVTVKTNRGVFKARRAIVTLPIGVLRSGNVRFHPGLPTEKTEALAGLRMGAATKLYLLFHKVFWDPEPTWIFRISEPATPWVNWFNVARYLKRPVLMAFINGNFARAMEKLPVADFAGEAMAVLRKMYGPKIPQPVDYIKSGWNSDPYSLGCYPYPAPGGTPADFDTIGEPVENTLFFAGDGTTGLFPCNTRGAYLTGRAAASAILKLPR